MAVGYGDCDDPATAAATRVEERVALARSELQGTGTSHCVACGEAIPEARRKVMPSARHCVDCGKQRKHNTTYRFKEPWAT